MEVTYTLEQLGGQLEALRFAEVSTPYMQRLVQVATWRQFRDQGHTRRL
jgi:hypothetical protein